MPRSKALNRAYMRSYMRDRRAAAKAAKANAPSALKQPADPAAALAQWSRDNLVVPPGHPARRRADGIA